VYRQKNELETVLSGMVEGVVAVNERGALMSMNQAAASLFGMDEVKDRGRHVFEVVHDPDIQAMVATVLEKGGVAELEVEYGGDPGRWMKVRGAPLEDASGRCGAVLVAEDYTQRRRIDRMRRDFVANASHELQTPIAAIKGALETLQGGALSDPDTARQFTDMAARQAERLEQLAGDLLKLSSVEHGLEARRIVMEVVPLAEVLRAAVDSCRPAAEARRITVHFGCPEALRVSANARLLEQAVINLLDNAIKYSQPDMAVWVEGAETVNGVEVAVRDQGCGIESAHADRIFERFYRVDKARSREAGGTGLGLSIVRHIALAHGGSVRVSSIPGKGSVFTLRLPTLQQRDA
jgi:two-component system phosphate regulon sensor histidine kinase PhoR